MSHARELIPHDNRSPAGRPSPVPDLRDLPTGRIRRIAAGGYAVLALTEGHDMYAWGGGSIGGGRSSPLFAGSGGISGVPAPVVVVAMDAEPGSERVQQEEVEDVVDCAAGDAHVVVLTGQGHVYVAGDNGNGQLGLAGDKAKANAKAVASWTRVALPPETGAVVAVAAGPRSSFIVTRHHR